MTEEPEEFVNLALDTVDKQQSDIPKTSAAQLLEMLCDHIDGATTFITQISIAIIKNGISGDEEFPFLKDLKERLLFTKMNNVNRIEASLMILTVVSYLLSRRKDLIGMMEDMLKTNKAYFESPQLNELVSARLSLFIGYYCDNIFKTQENETSFVEYFQLLVKQIQCKEQYRFAIMYQSIDALKNIVEDDELFPKIKELILQVFPVLL